MATFTLTTGPDTVVCGPEDDTVYTTSATLNPGDSLTGGAGTDVLDLIGGGTFRIDQLATFTGFEKITVDNTPSSLPTSLTLGIQPMEVDNTGNFLSVNVQSSSNWNGSDVIINVDYPSSSTALYFGNSSVSLPVTYDLTSNTFSHVNMVDANSDNITLLINNSDAAAIGSFYTSNPSNHGDNLVTADSTLDLSHTTVSGFRVSSTNGLGTTFTVGDLGTALQIADGAGHDTLVAQGFTLTAGERAEIFASSSIETITDPSGTYNAGPPSPGIVALTTGPDTVVCGPEDDTVYATSATLNPGDSLTGSAGTDVLALVGGGTFRPDQLATFTGFEEITLDSAGSLASLTLGAQPIEVDATGTVWIQVQSPSNWNGSDVIINGDYPSSSTALYFGNSSVSPPYSVPVTYDLTSNTFSHVNGVYASSDNITLLINNSDAAAIGSFYTGYHGDNLVTTDSTLDLSHTTVSGFRVSSTNGLGTTFTVGDLGTALQIADGAGHDSLVAQGFTLTAGERAEIFASSSIETITDPSGTYNAPPRPTIAGTVSGQTTMSEAAVRPFAHVTVGDNNVGATDTLTITLGGAGGALVDGAGFGGLTSTGACVYKLSGSAAAITSELDALVFTPKAGAPNTSSTTTITLSDLSSAGGAPTVDTTTTVIDRDPAVAPTIAGTVSGQTTTSEMPVRPFAPATVGDANVGATDTLTITLGGAGGALVDGAGFGGLTSTGACVYKLSGSAAAITSELDALVFTPKAGAPNTSSTTTITLSDLSSAGGAPTVDTTTTVIDRDPAVAPTIAGTVSGQTTTSEMPVRPFAPATVGDANVGATDTLTITLGGAGGALVDGAGFGGLTSTGACVYKLSGSAAAITSELDALVFTPKAGAPNTSSTTTITLSDLSSAGGAPTVDTTTTVIDRDPAVAPTIAGTVSGQTTTSEMPVRPFAPATVGDANVGATDTLTIALGGAGGRLVDGAGFSGLTSAGAGVYKLSGSAAAITSELDALVFTPKAGAPNTSSTTTFTLSDLSSAGVAPVVDSRTTVIDIDVAQPPQVIHPDSLVGVVHANNLALSGDVTGPHNFIDMPNFVASYGDLINAFGTNQQAAQNWYNTQEPKEQRVETFDGLDYVASYSDLINAFKSAGSKQAVLDAGATHFINAGYHEGRTTTFNGLDYIASYGDLINAFGANGDAGAYHYIEAGHNEGRTTTFDGLDYIASYGDLINAFGANEQAGAAHFIDAGYHEGRTTTFNGLDYIASYGDLINAFGDNNDSGAAHYINNGYKEGRTTTFDGLDYIASYGDLIKVLGDNEQAGAEHFINNGYKEGRTTTFDGLDYIANYTDLMTAFGANNDAGAKHYIDAGHSEGRSTSFNVGAYESAHPDLLGQFSSNDAFLTAYINTYKATGTFLT